MRLSTIFSTRAICALLSASTLNHDTYNIGHGAPATLSQLADLVVDAVPGASWSNVEGKADITGTPGRTTGAWGAYSIDRLTRDTGWTPMPMTEALADYVDWVKTVGSA